ncbi:hypothetical protein [Streptomyces sp. NPDC088727]|uniref:hypothetical protein n=1 Tax=Streptomyces sp. NPDC088727 TaxID=3365875 RepID=UPI0037F50114
MSDEINPVVIEPYEEERMGDAERGRFLLYDEDFEIERNPKYQTIEIGRTLYYPHFSVGEIGPWVFGERIIWLRNELKNNPPRLNNQLLVFRSVNGRGGRPERRLTLPDIERLAWAMYERGHIDGLVLQRATKILSAVAHQYGALVDATGKKIT